MASKVSELFALCDSRKLKIAIAESLTGGALAAELISEPGASDTVLGGIIAYESELKVQLLGVNPETIAKHGVVSAETAIEMATGVRAKLAQAAGLKPSQVISVSTTGVAGPGDSQDGKAGQVFIAISSETGDEVFAAQLTGDRNQVRALTVDLALEKLREQLET